MEYRLETKGVGGIIDASFRVYFQNFVILVTVGLVSFIPTMIMVVAGFGQFTILATMVTALLQILAIIYIISERYMNRPIAIGEAFRRAFGRFLPLVGVFFSLIIMIGVPAILVAFLGRVVPILGMVANLVFIGIVFYIGPVLLFVGPVAALEKSKVGEIISRSFELTKGSRLRVYGLMLLFGILQMALIFVSLYLSGESLGLQYLVKAVNSQKYMMISQVVGWLFGSLPMVAAVILYYDVRIRKDNFDLEMLTQEVLGSDDGESPA